MGSAEVTGRQLEPMPAASLPLRESFRALQSRANAGDALAACRLGMGLLRCAALEGYFPGHDSSMAQQEIELEAQGDLRGANQAAISQLQHLQLRKACEGVPATLVAQANRYVRQAALAGEPEAMIRYAAGETLMPGRIGRRHINTPEFDLWRREARPVLMRALQSGQPEAVLVLAMAHLNTGSELSMLLPRDAAEASTSVALARALFGDDPTLQSGLFGNDPALAPRDPTLALDGEQAASAQQIATDWHERYFQGRRVALADNVTALHPLHRRIEWEDGSPRWPGEPRPYPCEARSEAAP